MSPQLPLSLKFSPDQRFEAYVGQESVRGLVQALASGVSRDWLYLAGPAGSGKTHLLLAACAAAREAGTAAAYLPLRALAGRWEEALAGQESVELVCLDDVDAGAGHARDEEALFHFHNRCRAGAVRLLYSASGMPRSAGFVLPDLVSRLEQCTRLLLESPGEGLRREVLRQRAARRGLELDDAALDYLFRRVDRDLASLTALLDRLDRESLAAQRRLTVRFLSAVLND